MIVVCDESCFIVVHTLYGLMYSLLLCINNELNWLPRKTGQNKVACYDLIRNFVVVDNFCF